MIDEKKLIEDLENMGISLNPEVLYEDVIEIVKNQPQADCSRREWYQKGYQDGLNADKWIPVEERLPSEENKLYLTHNSINDIQVLKWTKKGFNTLRNVDGSYISSYEIKNIIAWQPLPQPYKKEGVE